MKRYLPDISSWIRYVAESEERMAINTPVQGTAAEILKLSMIELDKKLKEFSGHSAPRMLLTVHDELVVEASEKDSKIVAKIVEDTMICVVKLCVPIEVSVGVGDSWAETK
jgi:DNA polymerase-1